MQVSIIQKKKNRNKIYNKNLCQKYTTIRIPKYNNNVKKKKKNS